MANTAAITNAADAAVHTPSRRFVACNGTLG
jgi:hypothetical protein